MNCYQEFLISLLTTELELKDYYKNTQKDYPLDNLMSLSFRLEFLLSLLKEDEYNLVILPHDKINYEKVFTKAKDDLDIRLHSKLSKESRDYIEVNIKENKKRYDTLYNELKDIKQKLQPFTKREKLEYTEYILATLTPYSLNYSKQV